MVAFFILEHIKQQVSAPYYKDQNGQDEQNIQNVMDLSPHLYDFIRSASLYVTICYEEGLLVYQSFAYFNTLNADSFRAGI